MAWTEQERTLKQLQEKYGTTAFVEDRVNYKLVGFKRGAKKISAIGNTWQQAIEALGKKAQQ